jgi:hypothetical protein
MQVDCLDAGRTPAKDACVQLFIAGDALGGHSVKERIIDHDISPCVTDRGNGRTWRDLGVGLRLWRGCLQQDMTPKTTN